MQTRYRLALAILGPLVVVAGCSKGAVVSTIPVTGKVTYQGAPVAEATVTFTNVEPGGRSATAVTGADGTFKLQTLVSAAQRKDGALAGDYTVTVMKVEKLEAVAVAMGSMKDKSPEERLKMQQESESGPSAPKSLVPEKYASPETSGLKATVSATSRDFTLDLKD